MPAALCNRPCVLLFMAALWPACTGSKLARPLVIAGTVAAGAAAYGNRDKHAAGPLAVAAAVNGAVIALSLFLIKPLETEIEVRKGKEAFAAPVLTCTTSSSRSCVLSCRCCHQRLPHPCDITPPTVAPVCRRRCRPPPTPPQQELRPQAAAALTYILVYNAHCHFSASQALPLPTNASPNKKPDQKQAAADSKARSLLQRWAKVGAARGLRDMHAVPENAAWLLRPAGGSILAGSPGLPAELLQMRAIARCSLPGSLRINVSPTAHLPHCRSCTPCAWLCPALPLAPPCAACCCSTRSTEAAGLSCGRRLCSHQANCTEQPAVASARCSPATAAARLVTAMAAARWGPAAADPRCPTP